MTKGPVLGPPEYHFDKAAADHADKFFSKYLTHTKGEWAGRPFKLLPWQRDEIIRPLFGWKRGDGTRKYRMAYIEIPKKNGKSELCAGLGIYLTTADGEPGAEVYSAAGDREQASIVFDTAKTMVRANKALKKRTEVFKRSIVYPKLGGSYKVLSSDAFTKHGFNVHAAVFDEFHVQPNRELFDTLKNGVAARRQPLVIIITTAGSGRESVCWEMHDYASKVLKGIIKDPALLVVIYAAGQRDDWRKPAVWAKANPSLGITVKPDFIAAECERAQRIPSYELTFRRLHLNQWTSIGKRWLRMEDYDDSAGVVPDLCDLRGAHAYAGLDLSSTTDLSSLVLVFPWADNVWKVHPFFWMPADNMPAREKTDHVPFGVWTANGLIEATEGNVIDYGNIFDWLVKLRDDFGINILEIAYDPWNATQIVQDLVEAKFKMVPFRQGFGSMSGPSKDFETKVLKKQLHHGGHPVLRWNMDNTVIKTDPSGNVKPDKVKSTKRIDGIIATIMAGGRASVRETKPRRSVYAERGFSQLGGA